MYIDTLNNRYPLYPGDIMLEVDGWQLGDPLPYGWFEVESIEPPTVSGSEIYYESTPVFSDGTYKQSWLTRELTQEELAAREAPFTARQKLKSIVGLTDAEIDALIRGLR